VLGGVATALWIFGEHLSNHSHDKWGAAVNCLAFVLLLASVPIVVKKFLPNARWPWPSFLVATAVAVSGFILTSRELPRGEPFHVSAKTAIVATASPAFWLVQGVKGGEVVHPAHVLMWIEFTNLKDVASMIDSYHVEIEASGRWERFRDLDFRFGQLFMAFTDLRQAAPVDYGGTAFNATIEHKNIGPHETVQGWILFERPTIGKLRFYVKETSGEEHTVNLHEDFGAGEKGTQIQMGGIKFLPGGFRDISQIPIASGAGQ